MPAGSFDVTSGRSGSFIRQYFDMNHTRTGEAAFQCRYIIKFKKFVYFVIHKSKASDIGVACTARSFLVACGIDVSAGGFESP